MRAELERADVLAMPCVVAADGDRDSMPVVVKEAMAMELLVVASDEVGLPEWCSRRGASSPRPATRRAGRAAGAALALEALARARGAAARARAFVQAKRTSTSRPARMASVITSLRDPPDRARQLIVRDG